VNLEHGFELLAALFAIEGFGLWALERAQTARLDMHARRLAELERFAHDHDEGERD